MVGLKVLREELGTDQKQLGTDHIWVPLGGTLRLSRSAREGYRNVDVDRQRLCKELSTAYPQIEPRVVHNCPVDSAICNTFPV
jgi:hypothetical protein